MPESSYIVLDIYQFDLQLPYEAGHVLTAVEASVLNWHRAELIQKIAYRWLTQLKDERDTSMLSFDEIDLLQSRIMYLDATYQLAPRKAPAQSYLDRQLEIVARQYLQQKGDDDPSEAMLRETKRHPTVRDLTRRLIENRLGDLPGDFTI